MSLRSGRSDVSSGCSSDRLHRRRGFTLIEVVVTLTVIGVIAAVALPAMLNFSVGVDAGPLEPVRTLLLEARRESIVNGKEVELVLVPASGRYRMVSTSRSGDVAIRDGRVPLGGARVHGPDDRFRVVFRPAGMGSGDTVAAGGVLLHVEPASGRVLIER